MHDAHRFQVSPAASLLALVGALSACGSTAPPVTSPSGGETHSTPPVVAPSEPTWQSLDTPGLARFVSEHAKARLREVQPGFDPDRLAEYRATPASAPDISGRAVERLMDLAIVDAVEGRLAEAEGTVRLVRARAKNRNSAFAGTTLLAEIRRRAAGADATAQATNVEAVFRELPRARFGSATVVFQYYQSPEQVSAELDGLHEQMISLETASSALWYSGVLPDVVRNRQLYLDAIGRVRATLDAQPEPPAYAFGTVDLRRARDAHEVVVAVWDLGVATNLFPRQVYANARERENGQDDDGDGQVDDVHGLVDDADAPNTALLFDPGQATIAQYSPFLRGIMDLRAGMASTPAAARVLELARSVQGVEQLKALERSLDAIGEWAHGTHVAGILLGGVPQARVVVFRSAWAGESRTYYERGPTDAELARERQNMDAIARFIRDNHVRVVNASLGFSVDYLEDQLRHESATYHSDDEVRARARAVQQRRREGWQAVFDACPETLFVVAAGNENRDVIEYEDIPASLVAPNLISVGAVDRWGNWATFTSSSPERVRIFDHGVEVDSVVPSGEHVPLSGTSMASPNVANLAAKLFALDSALTPARAIQIIVETGDPIAAPFDGRIANETRAVARARTERAPARAARPSVPAAAH